MPPPITSNPPCLLISSPATTPSILSDAVGASGIGLVELYVIDQTAPANPVNISARGDVQTGDDVMIGGFIIGGAQDRNLIIRAIGPSLLQPVSSIHCSTRPWSYTT